MKIRAIVKKPREAYGHLTEIENELSALQRVVGGYIEVIRYKNLLIICNEDGNLRRLEPNLYLSKTLLVGTIIVCGRDGEEFAEMVGTSKNTVYSSIWHEKNGNTWSSYKKVEVEE